jgi:hypothetical protein
MLDVWIPGGPMTIVRIWVKTECTWVRMLIVRKGLKSEWEWSLNTWIPRDIWLNYSSPVSDWKLSKWENCQNGTFVQMKLVLMRQLSLNMSEIILPKLSLSKIDACVCLNLYGNKTVNLTPFSEWDICPNGNCLNYPFINQY